MELSPMYRFCAHYIFGYESKGSLCHHFYFCGLKNNKLYRICNQACYPLVLLRLFFSYYGLNPTCAVPSVHLLLHAESHVSFSTSSFVIIYRIPRVLFHLFIRYYMLNPTRPLPSVHLLLLTKSHVSGCSSLLIPSSRKRKKMFAQPPCCHFTIYEVFTLTKICHFSTFCYPLLL